MNAKLTSHIVMVAGWVLGSFFLGCSSVELTKIPKKPLPAHPPQLTELFLELPAKGGPRRPNRYRVSHASFRPWTRDYHY